MKFLNLLLLAVLLIPGFSARAESADELAELRAQFAALAARVSALESENASLRAAGKVREERLDQTQVQIASLDSPTSSWADRLGISGDFRYRYEEIDIEGVDVRERDRIRARVNLKADVADNIAVTVGMSTGGDDPISTNQTLGSVGSRKDLRLNLAYVDWAPVEGWHITAGKMKNTFYRPQGTALIWDGDYTPEGFGTRWAGKHLFVNAAGNWLESDSRGGGKQLAWGLQGGVNLSLGDASLTTGLSYFDLPVKGNEVFFGDGDDFYGNSFDCADPVSLEGCVYLYDYEEFEWFANLALELGGRPLNIFTDYVQNQAVDEFDTGWLAGMVYGKAKDRGSWRVGYQYRDLEADAVFGLLSDSDFAGGGTDGRGHIVTARYVPIKNVALDLTWFINNEFGEDQFGEGLKFDRIMLDAGFRF